MRKCITNFAEYGKNTLTFLRKRIKKEEPPQLKKVFKNTETPQTFCGNAYIKNGNTSTK